MRHLLTVFAILAMLTLASGCDVGGGRGPTSEQLAEAAEIERDFDSLRQETSQFLGQHEGSTDPATIGHVISLREALNMAESEVESLRRAPRAQWDEYKQAAELAIDALRMQLESVREEL